MSLLKPTGSPIAEYYDWDDEYAHDLEINRADDNRTRFITKFFRVIRILVECLGLLLTIPVSIIEIIAICYLWNQNKTLDWAARHKDAIAAVNQCIVLVAYFWSLAFSLATFPMLRKKFQAGWKGDLPAVVCLFLIAAPLCLSIEVFAQLAQRTAEL